MLAQLDRLLALTGMPNLTLGIIPFGVPPPVAPQHGFALFDDLAIVETSTNEAIYHGPEAATYAQIMDALRAEAVTDEPVSPLRGPAETRHRIDNQHVARRRTYQGIRATPHHNAPHATSA